MTEYQQNTLFIVICSAISTITCCTILLTLGYTHFFATYGIISSAGCLWGAYRLLFSKHNIH